jgi:hypothetical protein
MKTPAPVARRSVEWSKSAEINIGNLSRLESDGMARTVL